MHFLVFGATGRTGKQFVRQALRREHHVTACVRDPEKLDIAHEYLSVVQGDMLKPASLQRAFLSGGFDAVMLSVGVYHRKPMTLVSDGTQNIIAAMQVSGISRIGVVTSLGCGDSAGQGNFAARLFQRLSLPQVLADKERQEQALMSTDLDWTIVRPPRLLSKEDIRDDLVVWRGPTPASPKLSWTCNRANVAHLLLQSLEQGSNSRQALTISDPK